MTTPSNTASGRPGLSTRHTHHHGCGPPTNHISSFSYEGYLFVPSERHSREDRWTSAQRKDLPFSQGDLFNEVIKQQRSGRTALEEFCDPRVVDDAKHGMITNLIKERTTTESGSTYTLAAIKINKDYVNDEEPEYDETSLRGYESKNEVKKRREETISVSIILQGSVIHYPDHVPEDFSQSCNPNSTNAIESLSPAAEKLVSWNAPCTPTSSTPRRYLPLSYHNIGPNANGSDQSLRPQQVYERSDDTRTRSERSSSVTSFDTTSSSSPLTPTSATSNNDCFTAVDHAKNHNSPPALPPPLAHALLGLSMSTEPTIEKFLDENAQKQHPLAKQHSPTQATEPVRPYTAMSSSTQTIISFTDPHEDGRKDTLDISKWSTGEMRRPSTADHGPESGSMSGLATSEDCTMSTETLTDDGDSPLHPQVPRASSPDILERKPSWMDNMVPVIPPPVEMEPIETGLEEIDAESSATEDDNSKRSNEKDTKHQNARTRYQSDHPENGPRHSVRDESSAALPMPARQDIQASPSNAEAKGRSPLKPQYTEKPKYTDSPSKKSAKGPANEARYRPAQALGRLRSYEKPRPTDHTVGEPHQPIDRQERYEDVKYGATDSEKSPVSTSYPVPPLGKPRSYERIRPEYPRTTSASQPAGIRKIYKINTYNEPEKAPNKHVKFSQPLASSLSLDVPTGSESSRPDTPPTSPRTTVARDPTESPCTTSRATSRPPLPRQSYYMPIHSSDTRGFHHGSSKNNSSKQSKTLASREVKSSDGKDDKEKEGWACNRKSCHRGIQRPFATYEEADEHIRKAHKRDRTGSE